MYIYICMYVYVHICIQVFACMYTYTHTHTHTHAHTHAHTHTHTQVFYGQADPFFGFKPKEVVYADTRVASSMVCVANVLLTYCQRK
jgi:hypothetical protein